MDVLFLSRLQFAVATLFHFIFVPLTLGLSVIIAVMETRYVQTGDETYKRMAKFWGKLFLINFALGVVTGITLEFQFGTNWSRYSAYVGDIFGALLAIEASVAFFLESTFVAVWVFGWDKLSAKLHCTAIWLVAIASNVSALWILIANAWMQHPVGYVLRNGRAELDNFFDVILQPWAWEEFAHVVFGAWTLAAFFVLGVSAYHLMRKNEETFFKKSFAIAAAFALIFSVGMAVMGHFQGNAVALHQPAKLAAMEAHWETQPNAPMYLLQIPDEANERNLVEGIGIPSLLSVLAFNDPNAVVKGLKDFPKEERPPVLLTFLSFRAMVGIGTLLPLLAALAWLWRNSLDDRKWFLKVMLFAIPLPYIAIEAGWMVAEVGRQPWIVYGLMKTRDAVSPLVTSQVAISLVAFIVVYALLGAVDIYLLKKYAQKGPVH
ncbi:MAG: cytochrome ubiquinol oxidase subunit I [Desulfovibrionaceae bacterium]